jgi:hypothetical protein
MIWLIAGVHTLILLVGSSYFCVPENHNSRLHLKSGLPGQFVVV